MGRERQPSHGRRGLQQLIDRFLSPVDPVEPVDDQTSAGFTVDHDTDGVIAGENGDRGLFLLRIDHGTVRTEILHRGDPTPWALGLEPASELPWSDELRPSERYRLENAATLAKLKGSSSAGGG